MPSNIGKCKLFRIKHITLLGGEKFLRNKHEIAFIEIKCTFFGRKENTINDRTKKKSRNIEDIFSFLAEFLHCLSENNCLSSFSKQPSNRDFNSSLLVNFSSQVHNKRCKATRYRMQHIFHVRNEKYTLPSQWSGVTSINQPK